MHFQKRLVGIQVNLVLMLLMFAASPQHAWAGGGPENLVLVVNADSASSKLIANHYIHGRMIPPRNVIYLNGIPNQEQISLDEFRNLILKPIFQQIDERKIAFNTDYIVYSADFPTVINAGQHHNQLMDEAKKNNINLPAQLLLSEGSITSLTFFAGSVLSDQPGYLLLDANTYYRQPAANILRRPFTGSVQQQFEAAIASIDKPKDDFTQGREQLLELAKKNPQQVAVAYWLARFYAAEADAKNAALWLTQAIRMGWSFRQQTRSDLAFDKVKNEPLFKGIADRIPEDPFEFVPTRGFKQTYSWGLNGFVNNEPGQGNRYFLSTVLAVTRNQGTNEREAIRQLKSAMSADETKPEGTFYFSDTVDVRSTTRKPNFKVAIQALKRLGHKSEIITTILPTQRRDILGLSTGTPTFAWTATGSRVVPGAICENLTSYGGVMRDTTQTKLSEFIRNDAAGSSGTVTEPYAIQAKFPHPLIHAHYAAGSSLAEAFYQSVAGPFQLLIVGDALCQPWATRPKFEIGGVKPFESISGTANLTIDWSPSLVPLAGMEMYVDGVLVLRSRTRERIAFDTTGISDGYHELRLVAVANNTIETTGNVIMPLVVNNHDQRTELTTRKNEWLDTDTITFNAKSNFGDSIELTHNMRSIAKKIGREAEFKIPASLLGRGPVAVEAISIDETGAVVASVPIELMIEGGLSENNQMTEK